MLRYAPWEEDIMHIVIAVITAIAGLFWALNALQRSGFQFSSLNPFLALGERPYRVG